jgi:hypothetical protein
MVATTEIATGDWVSIELGDGWQARCRLVPRSGRPAMVELHVLAEDDASPPGEITITLLRRLKMTDVLAELARQRITASKGDRDTTMSKLHGRRKDEDILAVVAIAYEETVVAGSRRQACDVWEFLTKLHEISHEDDWPWPERYRKYTRSSVRTLIRQARERGYLLGDRANPRLVDNSATATLKRAEIRKQHFFRRTRTDALLGKGD